MLDKLIKKVKPGVGLAITHDEYIVIKPTAIGNFKAKIDIKDQTLKVWEYKDSKYKEWILVEHLPSKHKKYLEILFNVSKTRN